MAHPASAPPFLKHSYTTLSCISICLVFRSTFQLSVQSILNPIKGYLCQLYPIHLIAHNSQKLLYKSLQTSFLEGETHPTQTDTTHHISIPPYVGQYISETLIFHISLCTTPMELLMYLPFSHGENSILLVVFSLYF